ncbi:hypothetical protein QR78_14315 [Methylobacterium indicum]|uniref:Uncharacterized protein n=1 Tax=Methylobacterium indicum TaxID=1775910 RepID=A0ABR5HER1_9HYPH|nr:hypothetical protein QR78_14315 [Methylobacterium indicum]KMO25042.1 hypothetical protein QR79_09705 [Methylobacterium indicum]
MGCWGSHGGGQLGPPVGRGGEGRPARRGGRRRRGPCERACWACPGQRRPGVRWHTRSSSWSRRGRG